MIDHNDSDHAQRLRGGPWGPWLVFLVLFVSAGLLYGYHVRPFTARDYGHELAFDRAMFGPALEQPIPFSHRLHVTDKGIDCRYCHSYVDRSLNAGLPSVQKCLGCHDHIIPEHEEIVKLKGYQERGEPVPWTRVYYNPDHVFFPHFRHLSSGVECEECHGDVGKVDRLRQVTFYMGFCIDCHRDREAPLECVGCHQ